MGKRTKRPGAGSMVLAARTLTSHPHTGKDQKGQRVGKGREHRAMEILFFGVYPSIVLQCEQHSHEREYNIVSGSLIQYTVLRLF